MSDPTPTEEQLRALLAEARLDEPMPADVAARLDGVLADLGADRAAVATPLPDRAAARRRRRRSLVLAAAAAVAIGVGGTQVDLSGGGGADSGVTAHDGGAARSQTESQTESQAESYPESQPESQADSAGAATLAAAPVALRSGSFERDVRHYLSPLSSGDLSVPRPDRLTKDERAARSGRGTMTSPYAASCSRVDAGRGRQLPAEYDGRPAVLVLRPAAAGVRRVDLYLCGSAEPVRSTSVPAP